jgi:hypothetical protein
MNHAINSNQTITLYSSQVYIKICLGEQTRPYACAL